MGKTVSEISKDIVEINLTILGSNVFFSSKFMILYASDLYASADKLSEKDK